ncbi:MAG: type II toxin-antitoxin system VapC family toxin [Bdellovibrionales bacterium]|nr:type II toxin-antitoxin system VapC family toxin [Bdellovibrionales bacterium]
MVIDTSVLLAILFNEEHGRWCIENLEGAVSELRMSTVNYAETLILLEDRQPQLFEDLRAEIDALPIRFVSPDLPQAAVAAKARLRYPLNLGDCFVYALAVVEGCSIITLDADFLKTDRPVLLPS